MSQERNLKSPRMGYFPPTKRATMQDNGRFTYAYVDCPHLDDCGVPFCSLQADSIERGISYSDVPLDKSAVQEQTWITQRQGNAPNKGADNRRGNEKGVDNRRGERGDSLPAGKTSHEGKRGRQTTNKREAKGDGDN